MDPFVAEVKMFGCNFAPTGWALCNGQLLPISQNTALFSLLGTYYGGDGRSTFALPNLQGSTPIQQGQGAGLSDYFQGETGGETAVTLLTTEIPAHVHGGALAKASGTQASPTGNIFGNAGSQRPAPNFYAAGAANTPMSPMALQPTGQGLPHNNLMPYLCITYCIAMQGVFPPRG